MNRSISITLLIFSILIPIYLVLDPLVPKGFIFKPAELQELAQNAISKHGSSNDTESLMRSITTDLQSKYGKKYVNDWTKDDWFFNNAGGAMGSMVILHASLTEYLIFFGTALQTEGHSGVHMADDYFTILTGVQYAMYPGDLHPKIYSPGMQNHLKRGTAIQYSMPGPGPCFALELAQGWIPLMFPFGLADCFSSTLDLWSLWMTVRMTCGDMIKNMLNGKF